MVLPIVLAAAMSVFSDGLHDQRPRGADGTAGGVSLPPPSVGVTKVPAI